MTFMVNAACGSFVGTDRSINEDNFYFNKKHLPVPNKGLESPLVFRGSTDEPVLLAVFDGMGGECKGEDAARLSSEMFNTEYRKLDELAIPGKDFLYACCERANFAVNQLRQEKHLSAAGATAAAVYFFQDEVFACNVGDSKVFRVRNKKMLQISEDHTDEKIMSAIGIRKKPVLLQYLGIPDTEMTVEPYISKGELESGDVYILCSDGVTDTVDVSVLYELVCRYSVDEAVKRILTEVNRKNGADNATIIVIKIA